MSATKETIVRICGKDNFTYSGPIGKFIDGLLEQGKDKVITIGNDSVVMDLEDEYNIVGVSNDERTSWRPISQISRHPANGGLVKVTTQTGKVTTATLSHSFLRRSSDGIVPVLGSDLKVNDRIPIAKYIPEVMNPIQEIKIGDECISLDKDFGWFVGIYLADGSCSGGHISIAKVIPEVIDRVCMMADRLGKTAKVTYGKGQMFNNGKEYPSTVTSFTHKHLGTFMLDNFGTNAYNKHVPPFVYAANTEFISGIVSGYFDGDGNTDCKKHLIRCCSRSERLINDMCVLLAYNGIMAHKLTETSINCPGKIAHTLSIPKKYAKTFKEAVGLSVVEKARRLDEIIDYNEREDKHNVQDHNDMIPCLGETIAIIGKELALPGQSRNYRRWLKKDAIGRRTLAKYIEIFEEANDAFKRADIESMINKLKDAYYGNVVWDKIVSIEYLDDPKEYVYDFTVPGNDSFMVDTGILVHNTLNTSNGGV
jgi:DNA-directed RNA polymerase subunit A"